MIVIYLGDQFIAGESIHVVKRDDLNRADKYKFGLNICSVQRNIYIAFSDKDQRNQVYRDLYQNIIHDTDYSECIANKYDCIYE